MEIQKPKYKIGDSIVIRDTGDIYMLVQITGAYINIGNTKKYWSYLTSETNVLPVKEFEIIEL